jgi:flavin-dependent dehydrogenase
MTARRSYDVIVVGAGPAGLSAARTAARLGFTTLVLERLGAAGELSHPCSSIIAPVPRTLLGHLGGRPTGELYFRKIDLAIPTTLVQGYATRQHWLDPDGRDSLAWLGGRKEYPAAVIDKPGLLRLLAGQAAAAGAELRFRTDVQGLLLDEGRVSGVRTAAGELSSRIVRAAEGVQRHLCNLVLPPSATGATPRFGFIASVDLDAPAVTANAVGQFITLGRRYTSARDGIGMVVAPRAGRLTAYFTLFADGPNHYSERSVHFYLREYVNEDPRVRELCAGSHALSALSARTVLSETPQRVVADGFMGVGDAVTPAGYLGILPAVYLGRQAALIAVEAIDVGDTSARHLMHYEGLFRQRILPALEAETRNLVTLSRAPDEDLASFCDDLAAHRQALPFTPHIHAAQWDAVGRLSAAERAVYPQWDWGATNQQSFSSHAKLM